MLHAMIRILVDRSPARAQRSMLMGVPRMVVRVAMTTRKRHALSATASIYVPAPATLDTLDLIQHLPTLIRSVDAPTLTDVRWTVDRVAMTTRKRLAPSATAPIHVLAPVLLDILERRY